MKNLLNLPTISPIPEIPLNVVTQTPPKDLSEKFYSMEDLRSHDIYTIFAEEYLKDGIFDQTEKEKMSVLRSKIVIDKDNLKSIMKDTLTKVNAQKSGSREKHQVNNLTLFRRIFQRALQDEIITNVEEKLLYIVREVLEISEDDYQVLKSEIMNCK